MKSKGRIFSICVIVLFIGLAAIPMTSCKSEATVQNTLVKNIPADITFYRSDGEVVIETQELTAEDIQTLDEISKAIQGAADEDEVKDLLLSFLSRFDNEESLHLLEKLPIYLIFSAGLGRKILTRYHGEIKLKKLFATWHYPTQFGTTAIWGNRLLTPPVRILLGRQIGFMVGFVGLYIYVPPMIPGTSSKSFFVGSAAFAWGVSF